MIFSITLTLLDSYPIPLNSSQLHRQSSKKTTAAGLCYFNQCHSDHLKEASPRQHSIVPSLYRKSPLAHSTLLLRCSSFCQIRPQIIRTRFVIALCISSTPAKRKNFEFQNRMTLSLLQNILCKLVP